MWTVGAGAGGGTGSVSQGDREWTVGVGAGKGTRVRVSGGQRFHLERWKVLETDSQDGCPTV